VARGGQDVFPVLEKICGRPGERSENPVAGTDVRRTLTRPGGPAARPFPGGRWQLPADRVSCHRIPFGGCSCRRIVSFDRVCHRNVPGWRANDVPMWARDTPWPARAGTQFTLEFTDGEGLWR